MVTAEKSAVNVFLNDFETTAGHVSFANSLDFLKTMLLTKRVKGIVNTVEKLDQFSASVLLDNLVETFDVDKDHSDFTLSI